MSYALHILNAREEIDIALNEVRMAYHAAAKGSKKDALKIKHEELLKAREALIIASGEDA